MRRGSDGINHQLTGPSNKNCTVFQQNQCHLRNRSTFAVFFSGSGKAALGRLSHCSESSPINAHYRGNLSEYESDDFFMAKRYSFYGLLFTTYFLHYFTTIR